MAQNERIKPPKKYYEIEENEGRHASKKTDSEGWRAGLNFTDTGNKLAGPVRFREFDPGIEKKRLESDIARSKAIVARERRRQAEADTASLSEVLGFVRELRSGYYWVKNEAYPFIKRQIAWFRVFQEDKKRQGRIGDDYAKQQPSTQMASSQSKAVEVPGVIIDNDPRTVISEKEYRALVMQWVGAVIQKNQAEKTQHEAEDALRSSRVEEHDCNLVCDERLKELEMAIKSHPELMEPQFAQSLLGMLQLSFQQEDLLQIREIIPMPIGEPNADKRERAKP